MISRLFHMMYFEMQFLFNTFGHFGLSLPNEIRKFQDKLNNDLEKLNLVMVVWFLA